MPDGQPDSEQLEFWQEIRKFVDQNPDGVAYLVIKMKHGIDLHVDDLETVSLYSKMLTIYDEKGGQTMIDARNIYSVYVALKD